MAIKKILSRVNAFGWFAVVMLVVMGALIRWQPELASVYSGAIGVFTGALLFQVLSAPTGTT